MHEHIMPPALIFPALLQDAPSPTTQMLGSESTTQPTPPTPNGTTPAGQGGAAGGSNMFFFVIIMMAALLLMMSMSGRKEKKKRAQMLKALGKRDKVRTAGGIIGTVIELKNDEVLVETDRASNTRLWLARGSIAAVISSPGKPSDELPKAQDSESVA